MHKIGLNMIVKNEGARIERALASAAPWINSWVIVDTGSTDDTKQKIVDFFRAKGIPGEIRDEPFIDWSQARNAALTWARKLNFAYRADYFMLMDADMELVVPDEAAFREWFRDDNKGLGWDVYQHAGATHYQNRRFVQAGQTGLYRGVTHEYLDIPGSGLVPEATAYFVDHADGANRPEKFKRDIKLLKQGLKDEPNNERYFYYLAASYRDAGEPAKALRWFKRRVEAGGWEEEVWSAQVNYADCLKATGDEAGYIREMMVAYNMRPTRAEPMYSLARHYREKGMNAPALACAEAVRHLPIPNDMLFVNDYAYRVGIDEEVSIAAFYVPTKRHEGFRAASRLSLTPGPYGGAREGARQNLFHYIRPLSETMRSFKWHEIPYTPPEGWTAMNPSVTRTANNDMFVNVRCVNYTIDDAGRYLIRGTDGTANGENPIRTRNFIMRMHGPATFDMDPIEALPPGNMPCEWPLVMGFEDMRLFSCHGDLYASSTVRQLHADGNCEQVLTKLVPAACPAPIWAHTQMHRMLRTPRETEKNWVPIGDTMMWMHRLGRVVNHDGDVVIEHPTGLDTGHISGSSQLIEYRGGWLSIVHEARPLPDTPWKRYYFHRFAKFTADFRLVALSLPFVFHDRQIEFCAGLTDWQDNLVISYGYRDESARVATVDKAEMNELWHSTMFW